MTRLVFSDLVAGWRTWFGAFVVLFLSGVVALVCAGDVSTAQAMADPGQAQALMNHAGIYAAMNSVVVVGGVSVLVGYVVRLQRGRHALWQFAGLTPSLITRVVLAQVTTVAVLAIGAAALVVVPFLDLLLNGLSRPVRADPDAALVSVAMSPGPVVVAVLVHLGVAVVSASSAARRAGRTPAVLAVRAPAVETEPPGRPRRVSAIVLWSVATVMYVSYVLGDRGVSSLSPLVFIAALACAAPWLVAPVLGAWTARVPARRSPTWFLALRRSEHAVARSQAAVTLLAVATSLGAFTGSIGLWNDPRMFVQGLALFGVPVAIVLLTGAMTMFMASPERRRESATLVVTGVTWRMAVSVAVVEALITIATAGLVAVVLSLPMALVPLPGQVPLDSLRPIPWVLLVGVLVMVPVSVAPVLAARRTSIAHELRVPA